MIMQKRHIAKSITWRLIGSIDTFLISFFLTNNPMAGFKVSFFEIISKTILYYIHERLWFNSKVKNANTRHLIKPFTWRIIGTIDTFILSSIIFGSFYTGMQLSFIEVITKIILYYIHEKVWYLSKFGINER